MSTAARIDELRKKFEDNPRRYFAPLANELRKAGNLAEAITLCREFLPKQPEHMSGYIVFGQALYESGELSEARTVFEQALALDPENLKALRHLGDIAKHDGDTAAARRWYERVLEADPRNDDIAAQLATLATPVYSIPAVPESAEPPQSGASFTPSYTPAFSPSVTPAFSMTPVGLGAIPTPDAALRAVDFDEVNARLREPEARVPELSSSTPPEPMEEVELLDLDANDPAHEVMEMEAARPEAVVPEAVVTEAAAPDDPFGFNDPADDADFEEGLIAPEWPDTSELVARVVTPRTATPTFVASLTPDAVAAFGAEPGDPIRLPAADAVDSETTDSDDLVEAVSKPDDEVDEYQSIEDDPAVTAEIEIESVAMESFEVEAPLESPFQALDEVLDEAATAEAPVEAPVESPAEAPVEAPVLAHENAEVVLAEESELSEPEWIENTTRTSSEELPWLMPEADEPEPVAELVAESVSVADEEDVEPEETSFADVMPEDSSSAFVTETMGELLVSQGFTARAITVYEELVRRRPYDPVLTSRLTELHDRLADELAPPAPTPVPTPAAAATPVYSPSFPDTSAPSEPSASQRTAKERFERLAARRVPRRTPPRASVSIETPANGLASIFGGEAAAHDDLAARALADAFAPIDDQTDFAGDVPFEEAMFGTPARSATPMRSATPVVNAAIADATTGPFSFDRFFPDPATASPITSASDAGNGADVARPTPGTAAEVTPPTVSDDLAQFSAWLKGLGNT